MNSKPTALSGDSDTASMKRRSAVGERTLSAQFVPNTYSASRPNLCSTARRACTWQPTPMKRSLRMLGSICTCSSSESELARHGLTPRHARTSAAERQRRGCGSIRSCGRSDLAPTAITASTSPDSSASIATDVTTPVQAAPSTPVRMRTLLSSVNTPKCSSASSSRRARPCDRASCASMRAMPSPMKAQAEATSETSGVSHRPQREQSSRAG
mmetsp:Transcript_40659/g.100478  ORF Transcript_40659/g.100478 Transcript_40659/m.100478 type:complete len:213 (-) Transcript_40659:162-800(-)